MKATLIFNLNDLDDELNHKRCIKSLDMALFIFDFSNKIRRLVDTYHLPNVTVETNGVGAFAPAFLRKSLMGSGCSVTEHKATGNKDERILSAFETPLSGGIMWAHARVAEGPAYAQMRDWVPGVKNQPDDYLDSASGAILCTPVRIGTGFAKSSGAAWMPSGGTFTMGSNFGV